MLKDYFVLFSHNIVVKGRHNSAIYELQHGKIYPIPNILSTIIEELRVYPVDVVRKKYAPTQPELFDKYISYFLKKDLGFYTSTPNDFPLINTDWTSPTIIQNAIIEYSSNCYDIKEIFIQLDELYCKQIELRLDITDIPIFKVFEILKCLNDKVFRSVQLIIRYDTILEEDVLERFLCSTNKIDTIVVHASPFSKKHTLHPDRIIYTIEDFNILKFKQSYTHQKYLINIQYFTEAIKYNCYYNQKICIDKMGNLKNCLKHKKKFGNVNSISLYDCIIKDDFQELWFANVDRIVELKESEYRYCTFITNQLKKLESGDYSIIDE